MEELLEIKEQEGNGQFKFANLVYNCDKMSSLFHQKLDNITSAQIITLCHNIDPNNWGLSIHKK
jgi:hypothetical protein